MKLMLTNARIAFAQGLFNASAIEGGVAKFGADFLIEDGVTKTFELVLQADGTYVRKPTTMDAAMLTVADAAWKGRGKAMIDALEASKKSYRNGDLRMDKAGNVYSSHAGRMYVTAKSKTRPMVVDQLKTPLTEADGKPYSGAYVNVSFDLYAVTDPAKKGVFAGLGSVQHLRDGEAFSGGSRSTGDEFEAISEGADAGDLV
jgi:hypothetical protein